jgi:ketosteroid isomerase-like protein
MRRSARLPLFPVCLTLVLLLNAPRPAAAQNPQTPEAGAILHVLQKQADDWNRGDLEAFAQGYKDAPDILFIGQTIHRGYAQMLDGYRKSFPNREAMGTLSFSQLEVQPLDERFATVTGRFHLERSAAGGGNASGHYLLVVEKTPAGWKIVRDATTQESPTR